MKTTEGWGDFVVIHALDPEDASAIIPMRTAGRTQKGVRWRIDARKFFDALMEGVSPRDDVTSIRERPRPGRQRQALQRVR